MEMPDKVYLFRNVNSMGDRGFTTIEPDKTCENVDYDAYYHDSIVKAKDAEIASLHLEIDECHKQLNRWADAHNELTNEVELRKRIAELEAILEARGFDKI